MPSVAPTRFDALTSKPCRKKSNNSNGRGLITEMASHAMRRQIITEDCSSSIHPKQYQSE